MREFLPATLFGFLLLLSAALLGQASGQETLNTNLQVTNVNRVLDLSTQLVKISDAFTVANKGTSSAQFFFVAVDPTLAEFFSVVTAAPSANEKPSEDDDDRKTLKVSRSALKGQSGDFWKVKLASALAAGQSVSVTVDHVYSHALKPYPTHISQSEKQLVLFNGNHYIYSPYKILKQQTTVNLASDKVESYSKLKPSSLSQTTITYGPYENIEPFSQNKMSIHFENNNPFLVVNSLNRLIEVSHWGNIAVEETVDIIHGGAVLKGSFSRYDYQRDANSGISSVKSYKTVLPAAASDVYYRDEIGNISTSHLREQEDSVEVELRPRFPLFGGWKTHYVLGYNLPSYEYLFNSGDDYALKMRFIDHIYDDSIIDDVIVKIILPEGCKDVRLKLPFEAERKADELHFTYLDYSGRKVVTLQKKNLVEQHIQDFEVHYRFRKLFMLREPLMVILAFWLLFAAVIIYVRLDFSISKDAHSESKMRVAGYLEQIQSMQDRRSAVYQSYDDCINKFKNSKDQAKFQADRKKVDADYKELTKYINDMQAKLKQEGFEAIDRVNELQKLDKQLKEQIILAISYVEKLISGKMSKSQYVENEKAANDKRNDIVQKIDSCMATI